MTHSRALADMFGEIRQSSDDLETKRDRAFALIRGLAPKYKQPAFRLASDIIFPTTEARALSFAQFLSDGFIQNPAISEKALCQAVHQALALGAEMMAVVDESAAEELGEWNAFLETVIGNMPDGRVLECSHCGHHCTDTYAVMDGWTLCLAASADGESCYVQVHDRGEPVGSGRL